MNRRKFSRTWPGVAALLLVTSGCVVSSNDPQQEPDEATQESPSAGAPENGEPEAIASSTTTSTELGGDLQLEIYALERIGEDLLRLNFGVANKSSDDFILGYSLAGSTDEDTGGDISLVDSVNQQRYLSHKQSDGKCFCNSLDGSITSGATENLWVVFPEPPDDIESLTVVTPSTPPLLDVPVTNSSESLENPNLADRQVLDLTLISDNLDDQTGRTESGDEVSILLSSDVLFDTNSSDLTNDAEEILEQVAQEVDDANSSTVSIDGHADNTGDDSVNVPLSQERAESVESALANLITREGVSFDVEGHGSADPIADNNTEEGRDRNRRVSVTFEK